MVLAKVSPEAGEGLRLVLEGPTGKLAEASVKAGQRTAVALPPGGLPEGKLVLRGTLYANEERLVSADCTVLVAQPVANPVVIDHLSQTLLVGGLPFCPQACYADRRTMDQVVEQEATTGINVLSPYLSTDINERRQKRAEVRQFLDRCAQVGIYVQLSMLPASHAPQDDDKWAWVKEEVEAFRDHPALLSYYLADEPELGWAKPEACQAAYERIKALDPWHPVTMVFCQAPAAVRYQAGMDVVMTDPYPIPNGPVTNVADFCERIRGDLGDALPLWVVPQAFGGGEWWKREPSRQEERVMTYLALIHGGRGIQYFIRRPPAVNPTSPDLWSECRRLLLELGQLTPALAAGEAAPKVTAEQKAVHVGAFQQGSVLTLLVANTANEPGPLDLTLDLPVSGSAEVLFENRSLPLTAGKLHDLVDAYGTRAYRIELAPIPDRVPLAKGNLIVNPSFEEAHNVGTPDGAYTGYGTDAGASWFVDPRLSVHGRQCLRLRTPVEGQGVNVALFPVTLANNTRYRLSFWAKAERDGMRCTLSGSTVKGDQAEHVLSTDWRECAVEFTSPEKAGRTSFNLRLVSPGAAWFDAVQLVPAD